MAANHGKFVLNNKTKIWKRKENKIFNAIAFGCLVRIPFLFFFVIFLKLFHAFNIGRFTVGTRFDMIHLV